MKLNQKVFAPFLILILALTGIATTVVLIKKPTLFKSKASNDTTQVEIVDTSGNTINQSSNSAVNPNLTDIPTTDSSSNQIADDLTKQNYSSPTPTPATLMEENPVAPNMPTVVPITFAPKQEDDSPNPSTPTFQIAAVTNIQTQSSTVPLVGPILNAIFQLNQTLVNKVGSLFNK